MCFKSSFTIPAVAAISFCFIGGTITAPAYADLGDQLFKLLADDGTGFDYFGFSVAISGDTAIVGATIDDDNGDYAGSAYLFDTTTGKQLFKLLPNDGGAFDEFGHSVAIGGPRGKEVAIVGAIVGNAVYLFNTTTGEQIAKLLGDGTAGDNFGISVAISDATAIVGADKEIINNARTGSAYLFDTTTGERIAKLLADDGTANDHFSDSVAISGATAIVGAPNTDGGTGSAYLFDTTTGKQLTKLLANDGELGDFFGRSVAISGATALIGASRDGDDTGSVYLFDISDPANPVQIFKLLADDGAEGDIFGISVAISGATAIVGALGDDDNGSISGSAYLFDISDSNNPVQIAKLLADDGATNDRLGRSVGISGTIAIVGAERDDDNGLDSGSAYLFDAAAPGNCQWDVNGDGVVDHHDLVEVVHNLGLCDDPDNCPWDVNGDGTVNGKDVAAVARHFGACP